MILINRIACCLLFALAFAPVVSIGPIRVSRVVEGASATSPSPKEIYQELNNLRLDPTKLYFVRNLNLRRDVVRLSLVEGKLAFFKVYDGRVLGAVFTGRARALAVPRDPVDKRTLALFLGEPILDQAITRAYLRFTDDAGAELLRQIEQSGARQIEEPTFIEEWNTAVGNLNPWHSLRTVADALSSRPLPYFYASVVGETSGPFDILVDDRLREQIVIGQGKWEAGRRHNDLWASFARGGMDPEPFEGLFSPISYEVETTIRPDRSLDGVTVVTVKAARDGERVIQFELSRHLAVSSVELEGGGETRDGVRALDYFQNEEISRSEVGERGNDAITAVLPERSRAGATYRIRVRYQGTVITDAGNGVLFVGDRGSWYPRLGGNDAFSTFDLSFQWPSKLRLVATGKKIDEVEEGGRKSGRWKSEVPIAVAGFNLGEYSSETATAGNVRIEVLANKTLEQALKQYLERPVAYRAPRVPVGQGVTESRIVVMPAAPAPSPTLLLKDMAKNFADATTYYETLLGPFPFESLAISQIPGSFGQGWPGLLYLSSLSFLPTHVQQRAGMGEASQEMFRDIMPYHELAHQWWGNVVGWPSYRDQWINEGLANYSALLYAESKDPGAKPLGVWLDRFRADLVTKVKDKTFVADEAGPVVMGLRLRSSQVSMDAYVAVIYGKSTWIFHMIRMMLRDAKAKEPDARFHAFLRGLLTDYRHTGLTTENLEKELEKRMTAGMDIEGNRKMEWFFDQWVRSTGIPAYEVEYTSKAQANGFLIRGKLKQKGVPEFFTAPVPLYARNAAGRLSRLGTVITTGEETAFQFTTAAAPRKIVVDPERTVLCVTSN